MFFFVEYNTLGNSNSFKSLRLIYFELQNNTKIVREKI